MELKNKIKFNEVAFCMLKQGYLNDIFAQEDEFPRGYGWNRANELKKIKERVTLFIGKEQSQ